MLMPRRWLPSYIALLTAVGLLLSLAADNTSGWTVDDVVLVTARRRPIAAKGVSQKRYIQALREHNGNKTRTAETLGITREGLHKKLDKLGL